jgi:transposase
VQLTGAQLRELQAVPARALGVGRDQCWTLGRIGELVRRLSLAASIAVKPGKCPGWLPHPHRPQARQGQRKGFAEIDYARLLDAAHQQLGGPLVVVWDNLNTHLSHAMAEVIAARDWLTVYQLTPHAPELNSVEPVWSHLKRSLANLAKHNITELTALVKSRLRRMQYGPGLLGVFLAGTGLDLPAM